MDNGRSEPGKMPCSTCHEPIFPGARKCVHCDSYQDWRRHLSMGSSVLALLVALVSVIALSAPMFVQLATPKNSKVEVRFQRLHLDNAYVLASNHGVRPASIKSVAYEVTAPDGKRSGRRLGLAPTMVQPGTAVQLVAPFSQTDFRKFDRSLWEALASPARDKFKISIEVTVVPFRGESRTVSELIPLPYVLDSSPNGWSKCILSTYLTDEDSTIVFDARLPSQVAVQDRCGNPGEEGSPAEDVGGVTPGRAEAGGSAS